MASGVPPFTGEGPYPALATEARKLLQQLQSSDVAASTAAPAPRAGGGRAAAAATAAAAGAKLQAVDMAIRSRKAAAAATVGGEVRAVDTNPVLGQAARAVTGKKVERAAAAPAGAGGAAAAVNLEEIGAVGGPPGNATAAITPSRVYAAVEVAVDLGGTIAGATDVEGAAAAGQAAGAGTVAEAVARGGICPSAGNVNGTAAAADSSRVAKGKAAPVDGLEKSGAMLLEASGAEVVTGTAGFEEAARRASVYRKCSTAAAAAVTERDVQPRGQAGAVSKLKASARAAGADAAVEGAGLPSRAKAAGAATAAAAAAAQAVTEEGEVAAASAAGVAVRSRRASEGIEVELGVVEETWVNKLGKRVGGSGALAVEQELKRSRGGPAAAALKVQGGLLLPAESLGDRVGNRGGSISASIGLHSQAVPQHLHVKGSRGQSRSKQQDIPKLFSGLGTQPPLAAISSTARAAPATTAAAVRLAVGRPPRATSRAARGVKRQRMGMDGGTAAQFHANWDDVLDNFKPPSKCNIIHMGH